MLERLALRTLLYGFLVPSEVNRTQIGAFSLVYIFPSDRLDTVVLFHSERKKQDLVQRPETGVICSLFRVRVTRRAAQFCTVGGWSERGGYYIVMHCHSPAEK